MASTHLARGAAFALDSSHTDAAFTERQPGKTPGQPRGIPMSDFDRNLATARTGYRTDQVAIDAGLRAHMIRVYNYMTAGVALTGVVAWLTYQAAGGNDIQVAGGRISGLTPFGQAIFSGPLTIVLVLGTLGLVFFMSYRDQPAFGGNGAVAVLRLCRAARTGAGVGVSRIYRRVDHPGILHLGGFIRRH